MTLANDDNQEIQDLRAFKTQITSLYQEMTMRGVNFAPDLAQRLDALFSDTVRTNNPWLQFAGVFADDPQWDEYQEAIRKNRERERPGEPIPETAADLVALAQLCLQFARVERATRHEDGKRPETDSDHTVMLGIFACACAARFVPHLDLGLVAQYSIVHDFVEVHSGDVFSLGMSAQTRLTKEAAEHAAFERLRSELATLPWVTNTIAEYEKLDSEEARFVKIMDKVLPKLTHLLNGGEALRAQGVNFDKAHADHLKQRQMMAAEYPQEQALLLFDLVVAECARIWKLPPDKGT